MIPGKAAIRLLAASGTNAAADVGRSNVGSWEWITRMANTNNADNAKRRLPKRNLEVKAWQSVFTEATTDFH
jgi:hypothetical protein